MASGASTARHSRCSSSSKVLACGGGPTRAPFRLSLIECHFGHYWLLRRNTRLQCRYLSLRDTAVAAEFEEAIPCKYHMPYLLTQNMLTYPTMFLQAHVRCMTVLILGSKSASRMASAQCKIWRTSHPLIVLKATCGFLLSYNLLFAAHFNLIFERLSHKFIVCTSA